MTVEPGWYYAEGDPPGTVRRWNGNEWVGFPVAPPNEDGTGTAKPATPATPRFQHVAGVVSLKGVAIAVQLCLIAVALANLVMAVSLVQIAPHATADSLETGEFVNNVPDGLAGRFALSSVASGLLTLLTGILFVVWFFLAYRNISLWHKTRRSLSWSVLAWLVPFVNLVRPMTMMLEIVEQSAPPNRKENPSPTPVVAWWFLWVFAQFGLIFVVTGSTDADELASNVLIAQGVGALLGVIAAGFAVYVVQGVTDAQEARRRPTAAQLELMRQEAEAAAFRSSQSHGIAY